MGLPLVGSSPCAAAVPRFVTSSACPCCTKRLALCALVIHCARHCLYRPFTQWLHMLCKEAKSAHGVALRSSRLHCMQSNFWHLSQMMLSTVWLTWGVACRSFHERPELCDVSAHLGGVWRHWQQGGPASLVVLLIVLIASLTGCICLTALLGINQWVSILWAQSKMVLTCASGMCNLPSANIHC